jgi:hypothetical protein
LIAGKPETYSVTPGRPGSAARTSGVFSEASAFSSEVKSCR